MKKEKTNNKATLTAIAYVGPSIKNVVQSGTVFIGGYPPKVEDILKEKPFLVGLFVPVDKLAQSRKALRIPEGELGMLYRRAEKGVQ